MCLNYGRWTSHGSHVVVGEKGHYDQYGIQVELATDGNDQHAELARHIVCVSM